MDHSSEEVEKKITYFTVLTSSSRDVARSFLETYEWDLYAAVSSFDENQTIAAAEPNVLNPSEEHHHRRDRTPFENLRINIPGSSLSPSQLRLQSPSPSQPSRAQSSLSSKRVSDTPCESQRTKRRQGTDLSGETESDNDSDEADQENKGGEENRARETVSPELQEEQQDEPVHEVVTFNVTLWKNGFTIDDGPFKSLDVPENVTFVEVFKRMKSPREVQVTHVQVKLIKREEEDFSQQESSAFHGVGRTLAGSDSVSSEPSLTATQPPAMGLLVVDPSAPTTSIQLRLADGTRLVTLFNTHHTIRDVRDFIDASRPDGSTDYQLLINGFPPKPLSDLDQTIETAGIVNSVLIQKF